jgi:hypothetical protein
MTETIASQTPKQLPLRMMDGDFKGVYSNIAIVSHTAEEFVIDFALALPPNPVVTARVITSPGHFKRIIQALAENLKRYETERGEITVAEEPRGIGFKHGVD